MLLFLIGQQNFGGLHVGSTESDPQRGLLPVKLGGACGLIAKTLPYLRLKDVISPTLFNLIKSSIPHVRPDLKFRPVLRLVPCSHQNSKIMITSRWKLRCGVTKEILKIISGIFFVLPGPFSKLLIQCRDLYKDWISLCKPEQKLLGNWSKSIAGSARAEITLCSEGWVVQFSTTHRGGSSNAGTHLTQSTTEAKSSFQFQREKTFRAMTEKVYLAGVQ